MASNDIRSLQFLGLVYLNYLNDTQTIKHHGEASCTLLSPMTSVFFCQRFENVFRDLNGSNGTRIL